MSDALDFLCALVDQVGEVPGDIVECGVYQGRSLKAMAEADPSRLLWAYDSFEGMPATTEEDPPEAASRIGARAATLEEFAATMGDDFDRTTVRAGWFENTFEQPLPDKISVLHLDCDWYASVALCLLVLEPRVSEGGVIVIDDWGYWEGSRLAVYDWIYAARKNPYIRTFGSCQAYWIKGENDVRGK